jgi:pimeloyl-ACP methyl ester carboxylesterase
LPEEGHLVDTASGRIYLEERGAPGAAPVLLVHGSVSWAGLWRDTMAALAGGGYRAAAMDLPPMGWSDRAADAEFGRVARATRIADLALAIGTKPILVAHSFGAGPALEATLRKPDLFSGMSWSRARWRSESTPATPRCRCWCARCSFARRR